MGAWLLCCRWRAAAFTRTSNINAFLLPSNRPTDPARWLIASDHITLSPLSVENSPATQPT